VPIEVSVHPVRRLHKSPGLALLAPDFTNTIRGTNDRLGIGRGLAEKYLAQPNHTVIAAVRDLSSPTTTSLKAVTPASGSKLLVVKIENTSETDPFEAVESLKAQGISSLDIVIANAAICPVSSFSRVEEIKAETFRELIEVNTYSTLHLYKAVYPLLKAAADAGRKPKLVAMASQAASIGNLAANTPYLLGAYGASKVIVNYLFRRAHFENEWLITLLLEPGSVSTPLNRRLQCISD
jgi:norsolorinic acid ketoreductase